MFLYIQGPELLSKIQSITQVFRAKLFLCPGVSMGNLLPKIHYCILCLSFEDIPLLSYTWEFNTNVNCNFYKTKAAVLKKYAGYEHKTIKTQINL